MHIWDHNGGGDLDWNPGDQDPSVGKAVLERIVDLA